MIPSSLYVSPSAISKAANPPGDYLDTIVTLGEVLKAKLLPDALAAPLTRYIGYKVNSLDANLLPEIAELISMWQSQGIGSQVLDDVLRMQGVDLVDRRVGWRLFEKLRHKLYFREEEKKRDRSIWDQVLVHRHWSPDMSMLLAMHNRQLVGSDVINYWLGKLGVANEEAKDTVLQLSTYVPTPQEIIRYAVREVFNPELVKQLGLADEFPDDFRKWAELSGIRPVIHPGYIVGGEEIELDVAEAEWISHWVHASPTQSYQGLHRLRPDNIERVRADLKMRLDAEVKAGLTTQKEADELVKGLKPITVSDVARLLKVNDYAPIWRPMLTAISYTPLTRVDIRRMLQVGELTPEELPGRYQDIGYSPSDSVRLASFTMRLRARSAQQAVIRRTKQQITTAYELGVIGETDARNQLIVHGLTEAEANAALVSIRLELRVRYVRRAIQVVRGRYRTGAIDDDEALKELRRLSLDEARIKELVELWSLERTGRAREISAAKVLALYREGVIATPEVTMRLGNLGYRSADIRLLLEQAEKKGAIRAEPRRQRATPEAAPQEALQAPAMPGQ